MSLRSIIEQLRHFDTPLLANTIDYIHPSAGYDCYLSGSIESMTPSLGPTVGVAVTCQVDTSTPIGQPDVEIFYQQLEQIQQMDEPVVWVVKAIGSRPDHECVLGDGMGRLLSSVGCVGAVTDGGLRDIPGLLRIPFAAYGRLKTVHHSPLRFTRANEPLTIGGVHIKTRDVIHADREGVIRIPSPCLPQLPEAAARMQSFERDAHCIFAQTAIKVGEKRRMVAELLARYGFRIRESSPPSST
jgi:4-hydroxy-4-methyl-2-oxoglutarate aldolase